MVHANTNLSNRTNSMFYIEILVKTIGIFHDFSVSINVKYFTKIRKITSKFNVLKIGNFKKRSCKHDRLEQNYWCGEQFPLKTYFTTKFNNLILLQTRYRI